MDIDIRENLEKAIKEFLNRGDITESQFSQIVNSVHKVLDDRESSRVYVFPGAHTATPVQGTAVPKSCPEPEPVKYPETAEIWIPKRYYLEKIHSKKHGFIYYVRYLDKGKLILTRWNTHTNNREIAERYAIERGL